MTFEGPSRNEIPNLNATDIEWRTYWNSCSIGEIVNTLEKLIQKGIKKRPLENKSLYIRALECKEVLGKTFSEVIDKNNRLIKDIESGHS